MFDLLTVSIKGIWLAEYVIEQGVLWLQLAWVGKSNDNVLLRDNQC